MKLSTPSPYPAQNLHNINFTFLQIVGSYINTMLVHYDTGETMRIALTGNAENANIRLEKSNIKIDGTYISLSCSKGVRIFNRSDIMVG